METEIRPFVDATWDVIDTLTDSHFLFTTGSGTRFDLEQRDNLVLDEAEFRRSFLNGPPDEELVCQLAGEYAAGLRCKYLAERRAEVTDTIVQFAGIYRDLGLS